MWTALRLLSVRTTIEVPWATIGVAFAACALLAVVSSVLPAGLALRRRAVRLAGQPQ
jgi:putative ABC transport system permease protein